MSKGKKIKIIFVCLGNICRSPMAEFVAADVIKQRGLSDLIAVDSAGLSDEEEGNPVYPQALRKLRDEGVPTYPHFARKLNSSDYDSADLIVCVERYQCERLKWKFHEDPQDKIKLLLSFAGDDSDIDDPWYTRDFDAAYDEINQGVVCLVDYVQANML